MWRSLIALLLIPTFAFGQSELPGSFQKVEIPGAQSSENQPVAAATTNRVLGSWSLTSSIETFTRYHELRQGSSEELLVDIRLTEEKQFPREKMVIFPNGNAGTGHDYLVASDAIGPGVVPAKVEFGSMQGFTINLARPPKSKARSLAFISHPLNVSEADGVFHFKIHAASDVSLGAHLLRANISFQFANDSGLSLPQQRQIEIPIMVVAPNTKVKRQDWPYPLEKTPTYVYALLPLMVLTLPLWIIVGIVCTIEGNCRDWQC